MFFVDNGLFGVEEGVETFQNLVPKLLCLPLFVSVLRVPKLGLDNERLLYLPVGHVGWVCSMIDLAKVCNNDG